MIIYIYIFIHSIYIIYIYTLYTVCFKDIFQKIYIQCIEENQIETSPFQKKKIETTSRGASGVDASALVVSMATKTEDPNSRLQICPLPKDHWTLKTGYFEDPNPAIQVQTLPLEGPRSLRLYIFGNYPPQMVPMDLLNIGFLWIEI